MRSNKFAVLSVKLRGTSPVSWKNRWKLRTTPPPKVKNVNYNNFKHFSENTNQSRLHPQGKGGPLGAFARKTFGLRQSDVGVFNCKKIHIFVFTLPVCVWVQLRQISIFVWYLAWRNFFLFSHKKLESGHDSYLWKHVLDFRLFTFWDFAQAYEPKIDFTLAVLPWRFAENRVHRHRFLNVCHATAPKGQ